MQDKSIDQAVKEFAQWMMRDVYKNTSPGMLKFRADMIELFNDPDMFNGSHNGLTNNRNKT